MYAVKDFWVPSSKCLHSSKRQFHCQKLPVANSSERGMGVIFGCQVSIFWIPTSEAPASTIKKCIAGRWSRTYTLIHVWDYSKDEYDWFSDILLYTVRLVWCYISWSPFIKHVTEHVIRNVSQLWRTVTECCTFPWLWGLLPHVKWKKVIYDSSAIAS